jgi:2-(1,2-epoxy-1,2-dihydrophenyl)acetyl-CoA isomerase
VTDDAPVLVERHGDGVVAVVIDRPPLNLFDVSLMEGLTEVVAKLADDPDCRAIVLCSNGKHFCTGANLQSTSPISADGRHVYDVAARLFDSPVPIVAAVQGAAVGGGLALALVADFRVADTSASFLANFAQLGFHHGFGLSVTLPRVVGNQWATRLLYTSQRIGADQALAIGLCDEVVSPGDLRTTALGLAGELANAAPLALRSIRTTMRGDLPSEVRAALAHERAEQDRLMATQDFLEGVAAASEHRPPRFVGA